MNFDLASIIYRLQETELTRERLHDQHHALEKSLQMEREQRLQLEEALNTMQEQARLVAENKQVMALLCNVFMTSNTIIVDRNINQSETPLCFKNLLFWLSYMNYYMMNFDFNWNCYSWNILAGGFRISHILTKELLV